MSECGLIRNEAHSLLSCIRDDEERVSNWRSRRAQRLWADSVGSMERTRVSGRNEEMTATAMLFLSRAFCSWVKYTLRPSSERALVASASVDAAIGAGGAVALTSEDSIDEDAAAAAEVVVDEAAGMRRIVNRSLVTLCASSSGDRSIRSNTAFMRSLV